MRFALRDFSASDASSIYRATPWALMKENVIQRHPVPGS
jgi:hypothetical protein